MMAKIPTDPPISKSISRENNATKWYNYEFMDKSKKNEQALFFSWQINKKKIFFSSKFKKDEKKASIYNYKGGNYNVGNKNCRKY